VTKLNNYEHNYQQRIEATRHEEHCLLRIELAFWAMSLLTTVISPMMASAATFATFVLVKRDETGQDQHVLTAAQTFTVLLLFIALRFPISLYGRLIGRVAQARGAVQRLEYFMNRPIRDDDKGEDKDEDDELEENNDKDKGGNTKTRPTKTTSTHDNTTDTVLEVKHASFRVGGGGDVTDKHEESAISQSSHHGSATVGFEVSDITFSVKRGQVLALVGPVASGKSTIINGLIEEVPSLPGTEITMKGRVSFVSQTAFILNATLRENILFGLEFDQEWYDKVLDACCLRPDLEQLGEAGDLTEIGERGVTLSGGTSLATPFLSSGKCQTKYHRRYHVEDLRCGFVYTSFQVSRLTLASSRFFV
jgi:ABC-type multidrug transport system fused ATPase/permease subunit